MYKMNTVDLDEKLSKLCNLYRISTTVLIYDRKLDVSQNGSRWGNACAKKCQQLGFI